MPGKRMHSQEPFRETGKVHTKQKDDTVKDGENELLESLIVPMPERGDDVNDVFIDLRRKTFVAEIGTGIEAVKEASPMQIIDALMTLFGL